MISLLVEPRSSRRSSGPSIAIAALFAYAAVASIAAGAASSGAGLVVLAMGLLAATVVDFVLWREIAMGEPETLEMQRTVPALPAPEAMPAPVEPTEKVRAHRRRAQVYSAPDAASGSEA